ncbi:hypothetical protein JTB14_029898 [Gonioctena quinquepunctata]|nr:hypothetical protein JTB14_029898 [Gonioctena quinquepunctata]
MGYSAAEPVKTIRGGEGIMKLVKHSLFEPVRETLLGGSPSNSTEFRSGGSEERKGGFMLHHKQYKWKSDTAYHRELESL